MATTTAPPSTSTTSSQAPAHPAPPPDPPDKTLAKRISEHVNIYHVIITGAVGLFLGGIIVANYTASFATKDYVDKVIDIQAVKPINEGAARLDAIERKVIVQEQVDKAILDRVDDKFKSIDDRLTRMERKLDDVLKVP